MVGGRKAIWNPKSLERSKKTGNKCICWFDLAEIHPLQIFSQIDVRDERRPLRGLILPTLHEPVHSWQILFDPPGRYCHATASPPGITLYVSQPPQTLLKMRNHGDVRKGGLSHTRWFKTTRLHTITGRSGCPKTITSTQGMWSTLLVSAFVWLQSER